MENLPEVAVELFEVLVITLGAGAASVAGVALERIGMSALTAGEMATGVWATGMGLLALYVGLVALGYEQVLPRLRGIVGSA